MIGEGVREPPRQVTHYLLLAALALLLVVSIAASARPIMGSYPRVIDAAAIPPRADMAQLTDYAAAGALVMRMEWRSDLGRTLGRYGSAAALPRLGYFVRQWTFLGLPVLATDWTRVVYRDTPGMVQAAPVTEDQLRLLNRRTGQGPSNGFVRAWLQASWGLVGPLLIGLFFWLEQRWQARRRAMLGLI